uniref:glucan endo-1,3-beta-D-glucosidase n=1 Tax=Amphora coffeiformis TaxID=265554 RepID=A0A7S3L9T8_9STRA
MSWMDSQVSTTVAKGMPYATLKYDSIPILLDGHDPMYPTVVSETPILTDYITIDEQTKWSCDSKEPAWVQNEIQFYVPASDFTWLIFVSEPVQVTCKVQKNGHVWLQVVDRESKHSDGDRPFILRSALYMTCTKNRNPIYCHQQQLHPSALHLGQGEYGQILRQHSHLYVGTESKFSYDFDDTEQMAVLEFDWDVQSTHYEHPETVNVTKTIELLSYALPHHWDMERTMHSPSTHQIYCTASLIGPACLVEGSVWHLFETIPEIGIRMPRPPAPWALADISKSLKKDLQFRLPDFFQRGVGDTYFSGKMLSKLGRILIMAEEFVEICSNATSVKYDWGEELSYADACRDLSLPSKADRNAALASLRKSVQVWIDGTAKAPFVYDPSWGGVANCGCLFDDGECSNIFPDCPAFSMPGLNFGNAFYNDLHFHYGYHIYAAAVVAHFDPDWGKRFFERVLLLVRSIANPSAEDTYFPVMRHKDPYQGHSWASGIVRPPYLNGRNQESSSESIAAYESVAIYGEVMSKIFKESGDNVKLAAAERVRRAGKYATTSELRSTKRYYHIDRKSPIQIYPQEYNFLSIGIMWQTMAQFQTWFGSAPYLVYGIQLMPVTAIGEQRDGEEWIKSIYFALQESCDKYDDCAATGWSVQILGSLATAGHPKLASVNALNLTDDAFTSAGGNGHSLTNTLWYIATRPPVKEPLFLPGQEVETPAPTTPVTKAPEDEHVLSDCYQPDTCTDFVLDSVTDLYTCRQRIQWLMWEVGQTQEEACAKISIEFPNECGGCNPYGNFNVTTTNVTSTCPPCTERQCRSDLNRCPLYEHTFVCTAGPNTGGCSGEAWAIDSPLCQDCCELTNCPRLSPSDLMTLANGWGDNECPACSPKQCHEQNVCPPSGGAPYLCLKGDSSGGCSTRPWNLHDGQCSSCCTVGDGCELKQNTIGGHRH